MAESGTLYVVRHSESTFHVEGRWAGWLDPPLTEAGVRQATRAAAWWRKVPLDSVASSDLRRAAQGAHLLASALLVDRGPELPGLRERNAGTWQGRLLVEVEADPTYRAWRKDPSVCPPGGETYEEFLHRLNDSARFLLAPGTSVLAVTHDGVLTGLCSVLGLHRAEGMRPLVDAVRVRMSPRGLIGECLIADEDAL